MFPRRWVVLVTSRGCTGIEECSTADPYDPKEMDGTGGGGGRRQGDRQLAAPSSAGILSLTGWLGTPDKRR